MAHPLRLPLLLGSAAAVLLLARSDSSGPGSKRLGSKRAERRAGSQPGCRPPHKVVVVGAGFGGLAAAQALAGRPGVQVTVLDQHNHHLFQPLLYQVATAALSQDEIASPVRSLFAGKPGTRVLMEDVTGIDTAAREVLCGTARVPYDTLIVATGSQPSYFGHDAWQAAAPGLKTLEDARKLRERIRDAFERATLPECDPAERARLLTFVLVGGGATGVEMAGSIAELARDTLRHDCANVDDTHVRVVIVEGSPHILDGFAPELQARAQRDLQGMGVEVRTGDKVTDIQPGVVHIGKEAIQAETIIWTAGVAATPVAAWLGVQPAKGGRVAVGPDLAVPGHPGIYVIGDAALAYTACYLRQSCVDLHHAAVRLRNERRVCPVNQPHVPGRPCRTHHALDGGPPFQTKTLSVPSMLGGRGLLFTESAFCQKLVTLPPAAARDRDHAGAGAQRAKCKE